MTPTPDQPRPDAAEMTTARTEGVRRAAHEIEMETGFDSIYCEALAELAVAGFEAALAAKGLVIVSSDDVEYLTHYVADTLPKAYPFWRTRSSIVDRTARLKAALAARQGEDADGSR